MTTLTPTDASPSHPRFAAAADASLPRVSYAQRVTPAGERAFGYFSFALDVVVAALGERPVDERVHSWPRDHECREPDGENASPALPATSAEAALVVEELFNEGRARAFCTCCNRNVALREVRLVRTARHGEAVHHRYLCTADHLLLALATAPILAVAEHRAA